MLKFVQFLSALFHFLCLQLIVCKHNVSILGIYPNTGTGWTEPYVIYSAELAIRHIQESNAILSNYNLVIDWQDTQCNGGVALQKFFQSLASQRNDNYLAVFGGGCAVATSEVAGLSHRFGLSQIAYASTATNLGNVNLFPQFVRGVPSDRNAVPARAKFIIEQRWKRVAIINEQDPIFVASSHTMETVLDGLSIEYRVEDFAPSGLIELEDQVRTIASNLKTFGYRVIIANMYEDAAIKLFCLMGKQNEKLLLHPYTTWIFLGWFTDQWHNKPDVLKKVNCTAEQIANWSNGALGFLVVHNTSSFQGNASNETTISNYSAKEIYQQYKELTLRAIGNDETMFLEESDPHEAYVYDSLWTLALALHQVDSYINLTNFTQKEISIGSAGFESFQNFSLEVYYRMREQNFQGWSGNVSYIKHERRYDLVQILEFVNGSLEYRGEITNIPEDPSMYTDVESMGYVLNKDFQYWDSEIATDGIERHDIPEGIFAVVYLFSFMMVAYISFYIVFIAFGKIRKWEAIQSLSPTLTCIILCGNYFLVLTGLFIISTNKIVKNTQKNFISNVSKEMATTEVCIHDTCKLLCMLPVFLLLVASGIIFGGMISRAALIYIVAVKQHINISKKHSSIIAISWPFILTTIDTLYVLLWSLVGPLVIKSEVWPSGDVNPPFFRVAQCGIYNKTYKRTIPFVAIIIIYKSILVLIGLIMAYNLRNVKREKLRYANTISWTMYNMTFFTLVLILSFFLIEDYEVKISVVSFLILLTVFLTATIIGFPAVYYSIASEQANRESETVGNVSEIIPDKQMMRHQIESLQKDNKDLQYKNQEMVRKLTLSGIDFPMDWDNISTDAIVNADTC